jgi:hypothetical protein
VTRFGLCLLFLQLLFLQLQFPDRTDVLALMRRHPSWPGSGRNAAAVVEGAGNAAAAAAQPAVQAFSGPAGAEQGLSDSEDEDSRDAGGASDVAAQDMQDEVPPPATAAAALSPRDGRARTSYSADEQAVMRELNLSHLANISCKPRSSGVMRWVVRLKLQGGELWGEFQAFCNMGIFAKQQWHCPPFISFVGFTIMGNELTT